MAAFSIVRSASAQALPGVTSLDVVLVIDQSGSMWEYNDPQILNRDGSIQTPSTRMVAANLLAEWLATDQSGANHRLSVIMFGNNAKLVYPLQEIQSPEAQAAYKKALAEANQPMGATNILEAINLAKTELDKGRNEPNVKKALIFLSDGVCEPLADTSDQQRKQCEQNIRELVQRNFGPNGAGPIYTIALTSGAFKQDPANQIFKNLWQEISVTSGGDYYEPAKAGPELLESFVKILQQLFGVPIQSPPAPVDAPTEIKMDLPDNLLQVGFTLIKYGQNISMTVSRPDGSIVAIDSPGTRHSMSEWTESYNIQRPPGGSWIARVGGGGKVILLTVPFTQNRYVVDRVQPSSAHAQGKPMDIQVRVLAADQTPQLPQTMQVEVQLPDGTKTSLPMTASGDAYTAIFTDTQQTGTYVMRFSGTVKEDTFSSQQSVRVVTAPWLRFTEPKAGQVFAAGLPVPIRAQVMLNTQPLPALAEGDQLETAIRLLNAEGQVTDMQLLHTAGEGVYSGTLTLGNAGAYIARALLTYAPASGERFEDATLLPLEAQGIAPVAAVATAIPTVTAIPTLPATPTNVVQRVTVVNDLTPLYIGLAAFGGIMLVSLLALGLMLGSLRNAYQRSMAQQDQALRIRPGFDSDLQSLSSHGWQNVAAQVVADALHQTISINDETGILDASADPCPRFTLMDCDAREIVFTTDLRMLRKMKLVHRQDRVVDVSAISQTRHTDTGMLWQFAMAQRGIVNAAAPSLAHWYIVVHAAGAKSAGLRALLRRRNPFARRLRRRRGALK